MSSPAWPHRLNAVSFSLLTAGGLAFTAGFLPGNPGWAVATGGATLLYGVMSVLLWRRVSWAPAMGFGLAAFSAGLWLQSLLELGVFSQGPGAATSLLTCTVSLAASVLACGLLFTIPSDVPRRLRASVAFAGAALVPGTVFALAPAQSWQVASAMGLGSLALLVGAVLVGRGRTAGLLLNVVGAGIITVGVSFAPWLGTYEAAHPLIPNAGGFLVDILGMTAASLAGISTAIYLAPLVRFLFRRA